MSSARALLAASSKRSSSLQSRGWGVSTKVCPSNTVALLFLHPVRRDYRMIRQYLASIVAALPAILRLVNADVVQIANLAAVRDLRNSWLTNAPAIKPFPCFIKSAERISSHSLLFKDNVW
jgi:hypothetical protein